MMENGERTGLPKLQEETRAARGRALELVSSVVLLSTLLGLAMNIGSALLLQALDTSRLLLVLGVCVALAALVLVVLVPRISTSVKEFHEEVELLLPLLVSDEDVEGIRLRFFGQLDAFADALRRLPGEERQRHAALLRAAAGKDAEAFRAVTHFALEAAQFLLAVELVKGSRRLLDEGAEFHKARAVARLQTAIRQSEWRQIAEQVSGNPFLARLAQGVPEKVLLPDGVRIHVPDVGGQLKDASRRRGKMKRGSGKSRTDDVTLLYAEAGRDSVFRITGVVGHSEHGLPTRSALRRGLTTRAVLRNAEDRQLRDLAREEEAAAERLDREESRDGRNVGETNLAVDDQTPGPREVREAHAELYEKLFRSSRRPRLLRVFVRFDGMYRIRLLGGERRQRGLYAWGAAISRHLARTDIEAFMSLLKDAGQRTPNRTY